jgi:uncharacterized oligopeptide transporter (OPT) family protein
MAELLVQYKVIWYGIKSVWRQSMGGINSSMQKRGKSNAWIAKHAEKTDEKADVIEDPAPPEQQVRAWMWILGLIATVVLAIIVFHFQWGIHPGLSILACILGFIFSFLAIQIGAVTDTTPLTAAAKASQLVVGAATSGAHYPLVQAQTINLIAGGLASGGADVATSLTSDFRTGFLLGTPPIKQWAAQAVGTFVSVWLAPGMFVLFTSAYPCIIHPTEDGHCPFLAPSVSAWAAVAQAVTDPRVKIPLSSGIFACVMGGLSIVQVVFRHYYLVGAREKYREYLPNWGAIALSFVIPLPVFTVRASSTDIE